MQYSAKRVLLAAALALGGHAALAAADAQPAAKPAATAQASKAGAVKTAPKANKPMPVDINNASVEQLAAVPGLDRAHAMKIVANRPYPTRAWLVTRGILSETKYAEVRAYLVATPNASPKAPSAK